MGYYQQTLLIPKPTQRLPQTKVGSKRSNGYGCRDSRNQNSGINSILAYFD